LESTSGTMRVFDDLSQLRQARSPQIGSFGLVPTMGALHEGHLSLVRKARAECDHVGVSIFVNPTQFGQREDLDRYPRDLKRDLRLLEPLGVDLVWTPAPEKVYADDFQTWIVVEGVAAPLEGEMRPGHFRGVATIVVKLFNAFTPTRAYFGQKDAQQVAVIRRMVRDLNFPVDISVCPTVREADGLAMSSRNVHLDSRERSAAVVLFRALSEAKRLYVAGERDADRLRSAMRSVLDKEPLAQVDYVSAADPDSMRELGRIQDRVLLSLAARIGKTRLIDNFLLPQNRRVSEY
jgi:pantoate--beta-alanine ligase